MARLDDLHGLLACLSGEIPLDADWAAIIALANRTLCSPMMAARLIDGGCFSSLPTDVRMFLKEIHSRNAERNRRLMVQLDEAATVINAVGVRPIMLKGTAWLAQARPEQRPARLLADLDLLVPPEQFFPIIDQLRDIGYRLEGAALRTDVPAVLSRPQDAATIDLHTQYGHGATLFYGFEALARGGATVGLPDSRVMLPSAIDCIAILLLHDQLKGRDYLRGRIDLRHLIDMQGFAERFENAEWRELERLFASPYGRQAMRTQLLTARRLLDMDVPDALVRGLRARLQYRRRLVQLRWPVTAPAFTLLSMLDPAYLAARRSFRRAESASTGAKGGRFLPRRASMERLLLGNELGKI